MGQLDEQEQSHDLPCLSFPSCENGSNDVLSYVVLQDS